MTKKNPNTGKLFSLFEPDMELINRGKAFEQIRSKSHSGIESAIHSLVAGNDTKVCRYKRHIGYERYAATAVLGCNLQNLSNLLLEKERNKRKIHYSLWLLLHTQRP